MLEIYFSSSKTLEHLRNGPCGPFLDGFAGSLEREGYGPDTAVRYLRAAAHVGHVMAERDASVSDIDLAAFEQHLRACQCLRAKGGRRNHHTIYGARLFRRHLEKIGVCKPAVAAMHPAEPQFVADFKAWLSKHRGASDATIGLYARNAISFMAALGAEPTQWCPADIRCYFMTRASTCGRGTIEKMTTSLRAFLRYLSTQGHCRAGLDNAVPAYAHWQLAEMPRYLSSEQVSRLIAACDGDAGARRRDRAIVLLLARLGLRAGDVAQLRLIDIEWQAGSLRVTGKSRHEVRLPLPQDVGDAVAAYLECRPSFCRSDRVFLSTIAPSRPFLNGDAVSSVVRRVMKRAGLMTPFKGGLGSQLLPSDRDDSAGQQASDMAAVADTVPYVPQPLMSAAELDAQQPSAANARPSVSPRAIAPVAASGGWSYRNCRAARAAGAAPLYAGQPGYGPHMDGDGDGIACEPYVGPR